MMNKIFEESKNKTRVLVLSTHSSVMKLLLEVLNFYQKEFDYYLENGKLHYKKISNRSDVLNECYYDKETKKPLETIDYTYFPVENSYKVLLWKISKFNHRTYKSTVELPLKKKYKLQNNQLVEREKFNFWRKRITTHEIRMGSCGAYSIKRNIQYYLYDVSSTSIIIDVKRLSMYVDTDEINEYLIVDDIFQTYIHSELPAQDFSKSTFTGIYRGGNIPKEIKRELTRTIKSMKYKERYKDWSVEVATYDGKTYSCDPNLFFDKLKFNVDIFIYED